MKCLQIIVIILAAIFTIISIFTNIGALFILSAPDKSFFDQYYYIYLHSRTSDTELLTMYWSGSTINSAITGKFVGGGALCILGTIFGALATVLAGLQLRQICTRSLNVFVPMLFALTWIFFMVATALAAVLWTQNDTKAEWVAGKYKLWANTVPAKLAPGFFLTIVSFVGFFIVFILSIVFSACCNDEPYADMDIDEVDYDSRSAHSSRSGASAASGRSGASDHSGTSDRSGGSRVSASRQKPRKSRGLSCCGGGADDVYEEDVPDNASQGSQASAGSRGSRASWASGSQESRSPKGETGSAYYSDIGGRSEF